MQGQVALILLKSKKKTKICKSLNYQSINSSVVLCNKFYFFF